MTDKEKAALSGISTAQIAATLQAMLGGEAVGTVRSETERNPLQIELRIPRIGGPARPTSPKSTSKAAPGNWCRWPNSVAGTRAASIK